MTIDRGGRQRVLVTGGAGFIGSHLVDMLCDQDHDVSILDDCSSGRVDNVADRVSSGQARLVRGSILDAALVAREVARADVVYHLAAAVGVPRIVADPLGSLHTNVAGAANVLAACARHQRKVLVASSSEVYGRANSGSLSEDDDRVLGPPTVRRWSYAVAKALDEHLAFAYADDGLPMAIVRYFNSYGPRANARENASVVGTFIRQALRNDPLRVQGDGSQRRCFTFVADTVRGTELAATLPRAEGNIFNIGATEETSILTLAQMVIAATGSSSPIEFVPYAAVHGDKFEDVARRVPDIGRARETLGFEPTVSLSEGLARTVEWWREMDARAA